MTYTDAKTEKIDMHELISSLFFSFPDIKAALRKFDPTLWKHISMNNNVVLCHKIDW
jgi:hypothetical protein